MSKTEADALKKIETSFLKKHGYLSNWRSGTITWTHGYSGNKSSVGIETSPHGDEPYLRIHYTQTDRDTGEKKDFDYKVPMVTTPCRYGGKRYWFICPWYKNGAYCGRRVGTLYKDGDYFACRHCYNLTYSSRNESRRFGSFVSIPGVEKAETDVKRRYYRGKPTRKFRRYLKMANRFENGIMALNAWVGGKLDKIAKRKK